MASSRSIKINFQGESRDVALPTPVTLAGLQAAVASTFSADLPPRSVEDDGHGDLCFTYKDPEGDDIVFDKDSELNLALRLIPDTLEISAASKVPFQFSPQTAKPHESSEIYKLAARNLREYHGVPSMTPDKLTRMLTLLKLGPRHLVRRGLAPKKLLRGAMVKGRAPPCVNTTNEDLAETVRANMELVAVEDGTKELNENLVENTEEKSGENAMEMRDDCETPGRRPKMPIHTALVAAEIKIRPREVRPLLIALGVHPHRFVKLGIVDAKDLPSPPHGRGPRHGMPCGPMDRRIGFFHPRFMFVAPPPPPQMGVNHAAPLVHRSPHPMEGHPIHDVPQMHGGGPACVRGGAGVRRGGPRGPRGCGGRPRCGYHCG